MADTFIQIASTILGSNQSSVTISSIPQTYTDLFVVINVRSTNTGNFDNLDMSINGGGRRGRWLTHDTSNGTVQGATYTNYGGEIPSSTWSSGIFGYNEYYIPKYTNTTENKIVSTTVGAINANSSGTWNEVIAGLSLNTAAVTSITWTPGSGQSFLAGSLFQIYGILRA